MRRGTRRPRLAGQHIRVAANLFASPFSGDRVWTAMTAAIGNAIERIKRRGAVGFFRLASGILRYATILHRQRRISHNGLRTVLSGTRWLERCGAWLALGGRRKRQQTEQEFHRERID
jgi:hypothetical protein